jgi:hypothetical protein
MTAFIILTVICIIVSIIVYYGYCRKKREKDINILKEENMHKTDEQIKNDNEKSLADLMYSITSILAKEGFRPENHERAIAFKYEGDYFIVLFVENEPTFFYIDYHVYSFDRQEEYDVLKVVNDLNWKFKYSRILIDDDYRIYVRTVYAVNEASNIEDVFWRVFNATLSAARDFRTKMDYKKDVSLN